MSDKQPPTPKLSATILLLRDAPKLQVLMVKRHYQIDFASGALVFPGGKARDEDTSEAWKDHSTGGFAKENRSARIAAIREAFEESGILIATNSDTENTFIDKATLARLDPMRSAIDKEEASFLELISTNGLQLPLEKLVHYGHWITPVMMPKRFDTHFYIATTPPNQIAAHDGRETTDAVWLNPNDALEMEAAKKATIIFPTRMNLKKLCQASSVDHAMNIFSNQPVVTVEPKVSKDEEGRPCLKIPEEAGYGQTIELLENVKV